MSPYPKQGREGPRPDPPSPSFSGSCYLSRRAFLNPSEPVPSPWMKGSETVETLSFHPWEAAGSLQRPGPVPGSPGRPPGHLHWPPKAARAQGPSRPSCRLSEAHTGRTGSALKAGWLIRGSQTQTDPRGRWVARNPHGHTHRRAAALR